MDMSDIKKKLTSRKFWAAIVNFVTQLMIAFNATESAATQVAAVIMAGAGVIAYIVGEGLADAAGAGSIPSEITLETEVKSEPVLNRKEPPDKVEVKPD